MSDKITNPTDSPTPEELSHVADLLERIAVDRSILARMPEQERQRLLRFANQVALPDRGSRRKLRKEFQKKKQAELESLRQQDRKLLNQTGIRRQYSVRQLKKAEPPHPFDDGVFEGAALTGPALTDPALTDTASAAPSTTVGETPKLNLQRNCYTCHRAYDRVHHFYDALCPDCAELNWAKRNQTCDLSGRYAMITGGRVKIGYQAALKLLRAGATTVVTTRFPRDGARRFIDEPDYGEWRDRLIIQGVDLRHTPSVEALADHLVATLPRLDFLLNNACQTVRRPPGFYSHLLEGERQLADSLPAEARPLLESYEQLRNQPHATDGALNDINGLVSNEHDQLTASSIAGITKAAELSQLELVDGDQDTSKSLFPSGQYDSDQQQIDLRDVNSWRLRLAEVSTVELLEVQLVNAIAPFILNARLKPLMTRHASRDRHIVNVSAMEGVFYRAYKTDKHPHTNMAKAALNMLTRTSAQDYAADGIHMNSVDTGWITDEDPAHITDRKREELDFHPPLDLVDAAARICDPIFSGLLTGEHAWGKFWKDYQVANW